MGRRILTTSLIFILTSLSTSAFAEVSDQTIADALARMVNKEQQENGLVALGAAVSKNQQTLAIAVAGERKIGSQVKVQANDKWHLGSVTKSITATMLGRLVEQGKLQWDTRVGEVFEGETLHPGWQKVTLHQLLTHTGGAQADFPWKIQSLQAKDGPQRQSQRRTEVLKILAQEPDYTPGSDFEYSNVGYTIAALMAATRTGESWENLIRKEVFGPLGLTSGGFGPPTDNNRHIEQPRGHKDTWFSGPEAVTTDTDNSPVMGPAGMVHLSLQDVITYANEHMLGTQGNSEFLQQSTFNAMHHMGQHDYAYGWIAAQKTDWANNQSVLYHSGTNRYWYALLVMVPQSNLSVAITTNDGDLDAARESAWKIVRQIGALALAN